jgi:hypothetical protein
VSEADSHYDSQHESQHESQYDLPDDEPAGRPAADAGAAAGWEMPEPTGVPAVDEAVADVSGLDQLPTSEHVAIYDAVHRKLQDALADLDGA